MAVTRPDDRIGQVIQNFRIVRMIGEGGMGTVYEASHPHLARRFAIKLLNPGSEEAYARFEREAQITSSLGHPNIIQVTDFGVADDRTPYIVMELLSGEPLSDRLKREGALPLEKASCIFEQVASALQAAHDHGIVHRDLKPQNIFLCEQAGEELVKILDFGISKLLSAEITLTQSQALLGTPAYMSPEQATQHSREADHRSDIYSTGAILYEMLAGVPAFEGTSALAVMYKVVHSEPPPLNTRRPNIRLPIAAVVARAMSKDPAGRYGSMEEFARAFALARAKSADTAPGRPRPGASAQSVEPRQPISSRAALAATVSAEEQVSVDTVLDEPTATAGAKPEPRPARRGRRILALATLGVLFAGAALGLGLWVSSPEHDTVPLAVDAALVSSAPPRVTPLDPPLKPDRGPTAAVRTEAAPDARAARTVRPPHHRPPKREARPARLVIGATNGEEPISPAILLDGEQACYAPCVLPSVAPGAHRVEARLEGCESGAPTRALVAAGKDTRILLRLRCKR